MKKLNSVIFESELAFINIESSFTNSALPGISIVGLASTSIKESIDRIKASFSMLENYRLPNKRVIINLSPADLPKNGSYFDLAIALLIYFNDLDIEMGDFFVFGELGLDKSIKSNKIMFSLLLFLSSKKPNANVLIPKELAKEVALIHNLNVYAVSNLDEAIEFFKCENKDLYKVEKNINYFENMFEINGKKYIQNNYFPLDFIDVKGQENAKLACKIAALGMHNILFEGSPGCGKSMLAKRLVYIMPPISLDEFLEQNAYKSLNNDELDFSPIRSFRSPHRSSTISSILGGGTKNAKIGELALANHGVLFLDEFNYFNKQIIESLREPLEDNIINISRVNSKIKYDTKFLFVAAMNPCPCGNLFKKDQSCKCLSNEIIRYKNKISQPIYDRLDLYVAMDEVSFDAKSSYSSKQLSDEIRAAFIFAKEIRKQDEFNGKLNDKDIKKFCVLDDEANEVFAKVIHSYKLSARASNKVLKVARSLADFDFSKTIQAKHIKIASSFRLKNSF